MTMVGAELEELVQVLRGLPEADWDHPTACDGFRVRDVVGHLVLSREPVSRALVSALLRGPKRFVDLAGKASVEFGSEHPPAELLRRIEGVARNPGAGALIKLGAPLNLLVDHATHLQDVRVGIGQRAPHDPVRARAVLDAAVRLWRPITWGTRERAKGLRLIATDVGWSHGDGAEVRGPYDGLLLALSGRAAGTTLLDGPGLTTLTDRMPAPA